MSSNINVSLENPYSQVTIPRAKLRPSNDVATVIANPMALSGNDGNPYSSSSAPPPAYMVKEDGVFIFVHENDLEYLGMKEVLKYEYEVK
ncbi:hypothetical protein F2P81_016359 [Scophthalmus maximus]|uniref:Uncharacterized protein n=1 Tax=Scophthalmus maximus TaxID=52904 RepID=A0A6A4SLB0_SCOMX|nr:hypothetical protein F2P81_016359 [Scophthalmus maximus]